VIEDDEQDRDCSQAFYVRSKASILGCSPRLISRAEMSFVEF
jgi:hypothetical protein